MPRKSKKLVEAGQYEIFQDDTDKYRFNLVLNYEYIKGYYVYQLMQPSFKYYLIFADGIEQDKKYRQKRHAYLKLVELHTLHLNANK